MKPDRTARRRAPWLAVLALALAACASQPPQQSSPPKTAAASVERPHVAIASAHEIATDAGFEILDAGGNVFDAAVAVAATLAVVEPTSSGLGGGGFFLLHLASNERDVFVDAREVAPQSFDQARYRADDGSLDRNAAINGALSAGIPGLPAGIVHVAQNYGRLPLAISLKPAIRVAEQGFPVYDRMVAMFAARAEVMRRFPASVAIYEPKGRALAVGDVLRQPDLAQTLRKLGAEGTDGFYRGDVAEQLVAAVAEDGVAWTLSELAAYRVRERDPIVFDWNGWHIVTAPPPSSGGVALAQMLGMIGTDPLLQGNDAVAVTHLLVESMRRAYRDRTLHLGDPDFVEVPVAALTAPDYLATLRASIDPARATPSTELAGIAPRPEGTDTTHFSIIDADGNRVAATLTVNLPYGSGLVAAGTGVLLNNEMDDFALLPGEANAFGVTGYDANAPAPGKRMLSSMTPTFISAPEQVAVLGTPGGSRIITMVLLGILGFDGGLDPQRVTAMPRFHHQYLPDVISAEPGALDPRTIEGLRALGHRVDAGERTWGNMQAVSLDPRDGELQAGTDPRNPVGSAQVR